MVAGWMLYCLAVSALLTGAALLLEEGIRRMGWPTRWIWSTSIAASVLVPALSLVTPRARLAPSTESVSGSGAIGEVISVLGSGPAAPAIHVPRADPLLLGAWGGWGMILVVAAAWYLLRLHRARSSWDSASVDGHTVLISEDTGPAVVGWVRPLVVLPRWVLEWTRAERTLILRHEYEHLRARDPLRLMIGGLAPLMLPWNLPLWWQVRRLRLAIEVDCDARVVRRGVDLRQYASLLIEVGRRQARPGRPLLALAEPVSFLERRIRRMTARPRREGAAVAVASAAGALALATAACSIEEPPAVGVAAPMEEAIALTPVFTPRETEPGLLNPGDFGKALNRIYPPALRDAEIGGRVLLWLHVDEEGRTTQARVYESSGHAALDSAAVEVASEALFSPAINRGNPVPVWIAVPVTFRASGREATAAAATLPERPAGTALDGATLPAGDPPRAVPAPDNPVSDTVPAFTPRESEPRLLDGEAFARSLERLYPAALREAGTGGRVLLWLHVDEEGRTTQARVYESSGHAALDSAAVEVASEALFSPAINRGNPVPVWIAVPVTFQTDTPGEDR